LFTHKCTLTYYIVIYENLDKALWFLEAL